MCCGQSAGRGKHMFSHFKLVGKKIFGINWHWKAGKSWLVGRKNVCSIEPQCLSSSKSCTNFFMFHIFFKQTWRKTGKEGIL